MDLIPKPDQVVSAAGNVAHRLVYGSLADLRPMPRTLIDDGTLREVYHYRPAAGVHAHGDPVLLVIQEISHLRLVVASNWVDGVVVVLGFPMPSG